MINWVPKKTINNNLVQMYLSKTEDSGQFTNYGPNVILLEKRIREKFNVENEKAVIVVNNCSVAIHILAYAIEFKEKRKLKWATQSFTFPPSAQSNLQNSIILDIDLDGGINLEDVDNTIDGIIVTNIFGNIVNIEKYEKWAKENNKILIFDNAATCYTYYKDKNCINYGTGCGISFHHTKPFGFGEGGAIIIDKLYEKEVRCLINFGIELTDEYYVKEGTNGKMSDISASYILQYWDTHFDIIVKKHNELYKYLKDEITNRNITDFKLFPSFHDEGNNVAACFAILFNNNKNKNIYSNLKLTERFACRKYYHPLKKLKNSEYIYEHILCVPCTIDMNFTDIDELLNILNS